MEYFNFIPSEITLDIISRLPTESVLNCKLVSTNWRSIIRRPSFSKMHLDRLNHPASDSGKMGFITWTSSIDERSNYNLHYFEYDENHKSIERIRRVNFNLPFRQYTSFHGSCNGLICYSFGEKSKSCICTCICNPVTREYILLPEISGVGMGVWKGGFGYVSSKNEYKVVIMIYEEKPELSEVHVYTLGSGNGWRSLGKFDLEISGECVFVNGALYWVDNELKMIVPFDLAEEKFGKHFSPPPLSSGDFYDVYKLGVLDGCLYFARNLDGNVYEAECYDVWVLKEKDDNHGMKEREGHQSMSWSEERVYCESGSELFAVTRSCDVLSYRWNKIFIVDDQEVSTSETIVDFHEYIRAVFPHRNTVVSLKELGEETESHDQPFNQL